MTIDPTIITILVEAAKAAGEAETLVDAGEIGVVDRAGEAAGVG